MTTIDTSAPAIAEGSVRVEASTQPCGRSSAISIAGQNGIPNVAEATLHGALAPDCAFPSASFAVRWRRTLGQALADGL